ncbi:MAG: hypothetical protein CR994_04000 [Maribacter sp.]|nr:MAG: hypothetical protein CR994_04000 [Maribacter sp.]
MGACSPCGFSGKGASVVKVIDPSISSLLLSVWWTGIFYGHSYKQNTLIFPNGPLCEKGYFISMVLP